MIYSQKRLLIWGLPLLLVGVVGLIWRKSGRKGELAEQKQHGAGFVVGAFSADTEAQRHPVDIQ